MNPKKQKIALKKLLKQHFGNVQTEASFDWLKVPDINTMDPVLSRIVKALNNYRDYKNYFTPGENLKCDFYIPSINTIIEYDERQHFTIPRDISLSHYPAKLHVGFDVKKWQLFCQQTRAIDQSPKYRDEQRAIYDSLRDILAARNEVRLIRIEHGKLNWESKKGARMLKSIITSSSTKSNIRIGRVVMDFGITAGEWRLLKEKNGSGSRFCRRKGSCKTKGKRNMCRSHAAILVPEQNR